VILTAVDDSFLPEAIYLIKSCGRYEPQRRFYLYLVNSSEERAAELHKYHPNLIVEHVQWDYEANRWRGIMCCARSIPILHILETYNEPLVYLDSDVLVVGDLGELFAEFESTDLLVKYFPDRDVLGAGGTKHGAKFNSGVIAISNSEQGKEFAREYNRRLREWIVSGKDICKTDESCGINTCVDQEFLYVVYEEFKERIRFKPLPLKFNDSKFDRNSVIWHGKGRARKKPQYVREKLYYQTKLVYYCYFAVMYPVLRMVYYFGHNFKRWMKQ
jgi:lipopolysaccharide biosynthesis glycosyltransferase